MTIFVTYVKPSEAGYNFAGQGASQYFKGEVSNDNGRVIFGIVMIGLAFLGGAVSAANKK